MRYSLLSDIMETSNPRDEIITPVDPEDMPRGISKHGSIRTSYTNLVRLFGEPVRKSALGTNCEWFIKITEFDKFGQQDYFVCVYDINEDDDTKAEEIEEWNVGSKNGYAFLVLANLVNKRSNP